MPRSRTILAAGLLVVSVGVAVADEAPACTTFAWSVARERAAFTAPDLPALASGSALSAGVGAVRLMLKPTAEIALPLPSDRTARPGTFAGFVTAAVPAAGIYQVTLSGEAWIDASQDGRTTLKPVDFSGKVGCPEVRKTVRFAFDAGPVTIQVGSSPDPQIKLDLLKAE